MPTIDPSFRCPIWELERCAMTETINLSPSIWHETPSPSLHAKMVNPVSASTTATHSTSYSSASRGPWPTSNEISIRSEPRASYLLLMLTALYWQIPFHLDHIERTAFVTNRGKYCFNRMPFGVCNAPWIFAEMAQKTLSHIPELLIYMGDLYELSATWENHLNSLEALFAALQAAGLTLKSSQVSFGPKLVRT